MTFDYWKKQESSALHPNLLWSRPENKNLAGKLLIIGGSLTSFKNISSVYSYALKAGIGAARLVLPEPLKKNVRLTNIVFSSATPSGSFNTHALTDFLDAATWSDGILLAGDMGSNSETEVLIEQFVAKYSGLLIINASVLDSYLLVEQIMNRPNTVIILTLAELQKLVIKLKSTAAVKSDISLVNLIELLHQLTTNKNVFLLTALTNNLILAHAGNIITQKYSDSKDWQNKLCAYAAVWAIQNKNKLFEALSVSLFSASID